MSSPLPAPSSVASPYGHIHQRDDPLPGNPTDSFRFTPTSFSLGFVQPQTPSNGRKLDLGLMKVDVSVMRAKSQPHEHKCRGKILQPCRRPMEERGKESLGRERQQHRRGPKIKVRKEKQIESRKRTGEANSLSLSQMTTTYMD